MVLCDSTCVFHTLCGSFFVLSTGASCIGTLLGSGACDDCMVSDPLQRVKALMFPPRSEEMKK